MRTERGLKTAFAFQETVGLGDNWREGQRGSNAEEGRMRALEAADVELVGWEDDLVARDSALSLAGYYSTTEPPRPPGAAEPESNDHSARTQRHKLPSSHKQAKTQRWDRRSAPRRAGGEQEV